MNLFYLEGDHMRRKIISDATGKNLTYREPELFKHIPMRDITTIASDCDAFTGKGFRGRPGRRLEIGMWDRAGGQYELS